MSLARLGVTSWLVALVLLPSAVGAQDWNQPWADPWDRPSRVDLSASAGVLAPTDWSDLVLLGSISPVSGVLEQVLVRDVRVKPGPVYGAAVTYWRDRYGFRANAGYSRSSLVIGGRAFGTTPAIDDEVGSVGVKTWFYDVRGAFGLVEYAPARRVWPYVFIGFGGITYDLARTISPPLLTFIQQSGSIPDGRGRVVVVENDGRQFVIAVDELGLETVFAGNFGVGADFRIPVGGGDIGLRLELSDHVARSPLRLDIRELSPFGGLASDSDVRFGRVHHLRAAAGLVVQIGR